MTEHPSPDVRTMEEVSLVGVMAAYDNQVQAAEGIPQKWRAFLEMHPGLKRSANLYGASPCTPDGKIHHLSGVAQGSPESIENGERLTLVAGEYAVVRVDDRSRLGAMWNWLLGTWLPGSGRREKSAPEFERYTRMSEDGTPIGPVEIWIPLEPVARDAG